MAINWTVLSCGRGKKCPEIAKDEQGGLQIKDDFGGLVSIPKENVSALKQWLSENC